MDENSFDLDLYAREMQVTRFFCPECGAPISRFVDGFCSESCKVAWASHPEPQIVPKRKKKKTMKESAYELFRKGVVL